MVIHASQSTSHRSSVTNTKQKLLSPSFVLQAIHYTLKNLYSNQTIALTKSIKVSWSRSFPVAVSQGSTASQNLLREPTFQCTPFLVMGETQPSIFVGNSHPSLCSLSRLGLLLLTRWCILRGLSTCTFLNHHKVGGFQDLFR